MILWTGLGLGMEFGDARAHVSRFCMNRVRNLCTLSCKRMLLWIYTRIRHLPKQPQQQQRRLARGRPLLFPFLCRSLAVNMDVDRASRVVSSAQRRRLRRLRSWWRHERQDVTAALASAQHHSATRSLDCHADRSTGDRTRGSSTCCYSCCTSSTVRVRDALTCDREYRTSFISDLFLRPVNSCLPPTPWQPSALV